MENTELYLNNCKRRRPPNAARCTERCDEKWLTAQKLVSCFIEWAVAVNVKLHTYVCIIKWCTATQIVTGKKASQREVTM